VQDPLVGRRLDGRYLVRSRIARGGMATVYLALDERLDREVALKVMHPHLADDPQFTTRFIREARSAAQLSHPNVVGVFDQGADGDVLYLAMEYLRGRTLREVITERGVLTPREALTVAEPLLDALATAHRVGIVHRDVKPENVILTDDGRVKVADFGLARAATSTTSTTGVLLGTVGYLAPEIVLHGTADTRSDVYAAGIVLFEMLTGRLPFTGPVPVQVAYRHVNEQVPVPSSVVPGLPAALDEVVAEATARDPEQRPDDAAALAARLRSAHAAIPADRLDVRPTVGAPDTVAVADGNLTEVVAPAPVHHETRALPELGAPAASLGRPVGDRPPPPGTPTEDAELASLLARRRTMGMAALAAVLVLALVLAGAAWYFAAGPGAYTPTPGVVGLTADQATAKLRAAGLRSNQTQVFDETVASGSVVSTDPTAGDPVRKDGAVQLRVSRGPETVTVPKLVGSTEDDAVAALVAAHLAAGPSTTVYDDTVPKGQVVKADPAEGEKLRNGSTVTLTVSKGPQPVDVPIVTGKNRIAAEIMLRAVGLVPEYAPEVNSDDVPKDSVISQTPADGQAVPGDKVTLVVSKGPVLVQVPDVVGKQVGEARSILEAAGFSVRKANVLGGYFGTVRAQLPGGNSMAPKGSTIVLTIV